MTILSHQSILKRCQNDGLLSPYVTREVSHGVSAGISVAGYDMRLVLPGDVEEYILGPGHFILAATVERFTMPKDLMGIVHDKSSWARRGLSVYNTCIEPGWTGYLTLELVNHGPLPIKLNRGVGIAQVVFHLLDEPTITPYSGKYSNQEYGPVSAKFE